MTDDARPIVPIADYLFSRDTLVEAGELAQHAPERLTDVHLQHLVSYVTPRALADVIQRRDVAIRQRADQALEAAQQRTAAARAIGAPSSAPAAEPSTPLSREELLARYGRSVMTYAHLDAAIAGLAEEIAQSVVGQRKAVQALEQRTLAAEARTQALEQKVFELEAMRVIADAAR